MTCLVAALLLCWWYFNWYWTAKGPDADGMHVAPVDAETREGVGRWELEVPLPTK